MRYTIFAVASALAALPAPLYAQPVPAAAATATVAPVGIPVRADGLVGTWYPPADGKRGPVILVLGGSEGGEAGGQYLGRSTAAALGYGVLSLAYFRADGLPATQQEIPLEYFDRALAWIAKQPLADSRKIGLYGISVGGETALLVASRHPEIRAIVAAVPSSVIWQGINPADYREVKSTYSLGGRPIAFVPYANDAAFTGILDLYQRSLKTLPDYQGAIIPVERIGGDILLLSARDDKLWPSSAMSDDVIARLKAKGFRHTYTHIAYPDAGHGAMTPPSGNPAMRGLDNLGGTPDGNAAARKDMWARVTSFFAGALAPARR